MTLHHSHNRPLLSASLPPGQAAPDERAGPPWGLPILSHSHEHTHPGSLGDTTSHGGIDRALERFPYTLGPHRLLYLLGEGGAGRVYLAESPGRRWVYALKVCRGQSPEAIIRLKTEFRMLDAVRAPGIVAVYRLGCWDGCWGFTMRRCEGSRPIDFTRASIPRGRCGYPDRIRKVLHGAAESLARIHRVGLVHRDIKPSNFVVDRQGRTCLFDFSLAAALGGRLGLPVPGTELAGTFQYLAPEVIEHREHTPAADVFSLGRVLFQMLTGRLPSVDATRATDCDWFAHQLLRQLPESVPPELAEMAVQMQLPDPARRPTAEEIADRLVPNRQGQPIVALGRGEASPLSTLNRRLREVIDGRTRIVVLPEAAQITDALLDTFVDHARCEDPLLTLRGGNCAREKMPLAAWDSVLGALAAWVARLPEPLQNDFPVCANAALASLIQPHRTADPETILSDAEALIRRVARSRVLVVLIRRIDNADAASIELLRRLLGARLRILVIATRRGSRRKLPGAPELAATSPAFTAVPTADEGPTQG